MKTNVFIFFLDTIRVDQLRLQNRVKASRNFIERKLFEGMFFNNFIVAGNSTRISVNAVFNGFFGGTSGFNFHVGCDKLFAESRVIGLADVFRHEGYQTLAVSQGDVYLPPQGFDLFWTFQATMDPDRMKTELDRFAGPSFVYLHFSNLHDIAFGRPEQMTGENYRTSLETLSDEVESVWKGFVGPQDVVVIVSDHGCRLRKNNDPGWRFYHEEEPTGGIFLSEETIRGICSIIGPAYFPATEVDNLTRSVDLFPTLLDGLGIECPGVQGRSLWPAVCGVEEFPELTAYMETGGVRQTNGEAASRGVRTRDWKFVRYETWGEELYNLADDPDANVNLVGKGLPEEAAMRRLFREQIAENSLGVAHFQVPTAELCTRILNCRKSMPELRRGPRQSCFEGMITDEVRAVLQAEVSRRLPGWRKSGERIVVYSASEHSRAFLECADLMEKDVVLGVVDSNPARCGASFCGLPLFGVEEFEGLIRPTMILVGHYFFANDIYLIISEKCRYQVPVFNIYRLDDEIPLWWDRTPKPAVPAD